MSLRAVAARVDVTPDQPVPLAGYCSRTAPFAAVRDPLEINGVLIEDGWTRVVLLSFDLLYVGPFLLTLCEDYLRPHGIGPDCIFACASHTHFAPATDERKPALGAVAPGYLDLVARQLRILLDRLLVGPAIPVTLERVTVAAPFAVNRRRWWRWPTLWRRSIRFGHVAMSPNRKGVVNNHVELLRLQAEDGRPLAAVWNYACHPVALGLPTHVSAEYPGEVRAEVRAQWADVPVLFWQGFSGDVRPALCGRRGWRDWLNLALRGPRFLPVGHDHWQSWARKLAAVVAQAVVAAPGRRRLEGPLRTALHEEPLARLITPAEGGRMLRFQRLSVGDGLVAAFVSGEVVADRQEPLRELFPDAIAVGCAGDVFGYFPTGQQIRQGGYEAGEFFEIFGMRGKFTEGCDEVWRDGLRGLDPIDASAGGKPGAFRGGIHE